MLKNTDLKSLIIGFLLAMVIMLTVGAKQTSVPDSLRIQLDVSKLNIRHSGQGYLTLDGQVLN